jgi:hypothetical protein
MIRTAIAIVALGTATAVAEPQGKTFRDSMGREVGRSARGGTYAATGMRAAGEQPSATSSNTSGATLATTMEESEMVASVDTVEKIYEVMRRHCRPEQIEAIIRELLNTPGNKSFRDTIRRLADRSGLEVSE